MEDTGAFKTIAIVAAVIVVLGLVLIGSQYFRGVTSGAGAALMDFEALPSTLTISRGDYQQAVTLTGEYFSQTDLVTKNSIMQELQDLLVSLQP